MVANAGTIAVIADYGSSVISDSRDPWSVGARMTDVGTRRQISWHLPVANYVDAYVTNPFVVGGDVDIADHRWGPVASYPDPRDTIPMPEALDPNPVEVGLRTHLVR